MSVIRIVIADDHPLVLRGIRDFLAAQEGLAVVACCADGTQALQAIRTLKPEVAVLDLTMPGMHGIEVLVGANKENLATRVVFLSASIRPHDIVRAMSEGAYGLLLKDCDPDELLHCVRAVAAGQRVLPFRLPAQAGADDVERDDAVSIGDVLTPTEWKVINLVADGFPNKAIARTLNVTEGTVKTHLKHIFRKTSVTNRTALANLVFHGTKYGPAL